MRQMKKKPTALLLCLVMLVGVIAFSSQAYSDTSGADDLLLSGLLSSSSSESEGMEFSKTAVENEDGTYTITLEAYATGEEVISTIYQDIPTDIVLVLDQSTSMYNDTIESEELVAYATTDTNKSYYARYNANNSCLYAYVNGTLTQVTITRSSSTSQGQGSSSDYTYTYSYSYTQNNKTQTASFTSTGASSVPSLTAFDGGVMYGYMTRLQALKEALNAFVESVNEKAAGDDGVLGTDDDVNHRVAMVGFACDEDSSSSYEAYENTEIFIGSNQYNYQNITEEIFTSAFQNMDSTEGQANVVNSIKALSASGVTYPSYGLELANSILNANPVAEGETRNRVIIIFSDGQPGAYTYGMDYDEATAAIAQTALAKENGVTVYTVGIFDGADATSGGTQPPTSGSVTKGLTTATIAAYSNWLLQQLSSNNGSVQSPSYYLSAADAQSLTSIFTQISEQLDSGAQVTATLSSKAILRDVISEAFTLPDGVTAADIDVSTYACTGVDSEGNYTWEKNNSTLGAVVTITSTDSSDETTTKNQVNVTGFDYVENYVGTITTDGEVAYHGNKLVISFIVEVRDGFLGGNGVYTNTAAGVYESEETTTPVVIFERPTVDVEVSEILIEGVATDHATYVFDDVSLTDLLCVSIDEEDIEIDLDLSAGEEGNWGLDEWQNEYIDVDITLYILDENSQYVEVPLDEGLSTIREDTHYEIKITVTPKKEGTFQGNSAEFESFVEVLYPYISVDCSTLYYGTSVADYLQNGSFDFSANVDLKNIVWETRQGNTEEVLTIIGEEPAIKGLTFEAEGISVDDETFGKEDIGVNVTVGEIGDYTGGDIMDYIYFKGSEDCTEEHLGSADCDEFYIHIETCTLTLTKSGGDDDEPYVFDIYKDGQFYTQATIVGNDSVVLKELPLGTYTLKEDTGWSWRYQATYGSAVTLTAENTDGTITCTNTLVNSKWLNAFSQVVTNVFGVSKNADDLR